MPFFKARKNFIYLFFLSLSFFVLSVNQVLAADLSAIPSASTVSVGDTVRVKIVLKSSGTPANAVSGALSFSSNLLTLTSVSKTDSVVNVWPVEPSYSNATGLVNLDGVILSGYSGQNGLVLTLVFKAKAQGVAYVKFNSASVLAHDGLGTPILNNTNQTTISINASTPVVDVPQLPKETPKVETPAISNNTKKVGSIEIEEIRKKDEFDSRSRFLITSVGKKPGASYRIEIDNNSYVWQDNESHIFETVPLSRGIHSIKVSTDSINGDIITESLSFNTNSILIPTFTDFSTSVNENDFIVIKGLADPMNFVVITSDAVLDAGGRTLHESTTVRANEKGLFTFVSENRASKGIYMITAQARTPSGIESGQSTPVKIAVSASTKSLVGKITNTVSIFIPFISVIILLIILVIYGWHRILHYRLRMRKRLMETRGLIEKSFSILEEDLSEEEKIVKKMKSIEPLTKEERAFVAQFKKDMHSAEKTILNDVKDSDKSI